MLVNRASIHITPQQNALPQVLLVSSVDQLGILEAKNVPLRLSYGKVLVLRQKLYATQTESFLLPIFPLLTKD